jgi:muramoyltetrapeptide carboxypeptidase
MTLDSKPTLTIYSPAGVVLKAAPVKRAAARLKARGFAVRIDEAALLKSQRFAGDDEQRLAAIHRVAAEAPSVAMATRGGYGLSRLLDRLDWDLLARSVAQGTRWVGHSDLTALQMGLLAHKKAPTWCGPMAAGDFGADDLDEVTPDCFCEAMFGVEAVGFRAPPDLMA